MVRCLRKQGRTYRLRIPKDLIKSLGWTYDTLLDTSISPRGRLVYQPAGDITFPRGTYPISKHGIGAGDITIEPDWIRPQEITKPFRVELSAEHDRLVIERSYNE